MKIDAEEGQERALACQELVDLLNMLWHYAHVLVKKIDTGCQVLV